MLLSWFAELGAGVALHQCGKREYLQMLDKIDLSLTIRLEQGRFDAPVIV